MREDRNVVVPGSGNGKGFSRAEKRPWKPMPSIWKFEIHLSVHDWLLLLFGLFRRYDSATTLYGWKNGKANLYIDYMFRRMRKQVHLKLYAQAVDTMWILMGSHSYQVCCFNYIAKGWYKTMDLKTVKATMKKVKSLVRQRATDINYKRVYLEEPTKFRPLGVPTLAWRVYLHMYNNLITEWRLETEKGWQHAYLPGKGVITAWEALFELIHTEPNIYEADYKGFFNNVTHIGLHKTLTLELKLPTDEAYFIWNLNQSIVKLEKVDKIYEEDRNYTYNPNNPKLRPEGLMDPKWKPRVQDAFYNPNNPELMPEGQMSLDLHTKAFWGKIKLRGVPQGAPTSCSLATLALRYLEYFYKIIAYADDIIYFPKDPSKDHANDLTVPQLGLFVHEGKSVLSKVNGEWIKDSIKFLGFRYYPEKYHDTIWESMGYYVWLILALDLILIGLPCFSVLYFYLAYKQRWERYKPRFRAETRNGATLEFGDKESLIMYLNNARTLLLNSSIKQELNGPSLAKWILYHYANWAQLNNPASLLFESRTFAKYFGIKFTGPGVRLNKNKLIMPITEYDSMNSILKRWWSKDGVRFFDRPYELFEIPHIPLTGWMMSRMQNNSWNSHVEQNFKLKPAKGSWTDVCWQSYRKSQGLSAKVLTTFTASSFACHDLLMWPYKRVKGKIRFISTKRAKRAKGKASGTTTL
jgi:hypothetical protein